MSDKQKVIIFGYGYYGAKLYRELLNSRQYAVIGFADNSPYKQGMFVDECQVKSMHELIDIKRHIKFSVIIASKKWYIIGEQLEKNNIAIEGIYLGDKITAYERMDFKLLDLTKPIKLYAGDICDDVHMSDPDLYGLSINKADDKHIYHDITNPYPLPDDSICSYQAEDVLEHIDKEKLISVINEVYRILIEGGGIPNMFTRLL